MKNVFIAMVLLITLQSYSQSKITISEGTLVKAKLTKQINGRDLNVGDKLQFVLDNDLIKNDTIICKKGSLIAGTVTDAKGSRMLGKKGRLAFTIDYLYLPDNQVVKLTSQNKANLKGSGFDVAAASVLLTPFALFLHGKNAKYKEGTLFDCYVSQATEVFVSSK